MNKVGPDTTMVHYVYILKCRNGMLYTGYTNNIERRIAEHKRGPLQSLREADYL